MVPGPRIAPVRALLDARCRLDPRHPENVVVSIYFDTPALDLLEDKLSGALCKRKVRIRWYEEDPAAVAGPDAFLEVKLRWGNQRRKLREPAPHPAAWYRRRSLADPALRMVPGLRRDAADLPRAALLPFLVVRYHRRRYVDPATGSRLSLDTAIGAPRVHPGLLPHARPAPMPHAVVEVKNRSGETPPGLRPLARLGALPRAFSKYAACFDGCRSARPAEAWN